MLVTASRVNRFNTVVGVLTGCVFFISRSSQYLRAAAQQVGSSVLTPHQPRSYPTSEQRQSDQLHPNLITPPPKPGGVTPGRCKDSPLARISVTGTAAGGAP